MVMSLIVSYCADFDECACVCYVKLGDYNF